MLLIFSLIPILGHILEYLFKKKTIIYILLLAVLLTLPLLFGYEYFIRQLILIPELLLFGGIYSFFTGSIEKKAAKVILSGTLTIALILILVFVSFMNAMAGSQTVQQKWERNNYRIEYIRDQGFAGGALLKYELRKYAIIPVFIKKIETVRDTCTSNCCIINFPDEKVSFNSCTGKLKSMGPNANGH